MENKDLPTSNSKTVTKKETRYEEMEVDVDAAAGSSHSTEKGHKQNKDVRVLAALSRLETLTLCGASTSTSLVGPSCPIPTSVPVTLDEIAGPFSTPYQILPREVWVEVFKKCPKEFQTAINICPDFFGLLGDQRKIKLFPQVLEILFDKANLEWSEEHQISHKDLLQLRGVCSSWNHGVMDYLQNHPGHLELYFFPNDACSAFQFDTTDWTQSAAWIADGFRHKVFDMISVNQMVAHLLENVEHFQKFHKSIFVSRYFAMDDRLMGPMEELVGFPNARKAKCLFYVNLTMLLFSFGASLWYFDFAICGIPENCLWPLVDFWVSRLPNLRTLTIQYTKVLDGDPAAFQELADEMENVFRRQSSPLESLPYMKILDFKNTPSQIVRGILRKCGNLEKLRIDNDCALIDRLGFAFPAIDKVLQKLKELTIIIRNSLDFGQLEISGFGVGSPVKKLFLNCLNNAPEEHENLPIHVPQDVVAMPALERYWCWQRIFDLLEHRFSSTLTDLKLILPRATREEDKQQILEQCPEYRLRLSNLKLLKISIPNWSSIDFILPMENSLEYLEIIVCHDNAVQEENRQSEEILFNNITDQMLESNIWNKFPKLEELCVATLQPGQNPIEFESYERYTFTRVEAKLAEMWKKSEQNAE